LHGLDDEGLCKLTDMATVTRFVDACSALRFWPREEAFAG
jgi:hypothetical protein